MRNIPRIRTGLPSVAERAAIRQSVDQLRKLDFDKHYFDVETGADGVHVGINPDAVTELCWSPELPFSVFPDRQKPGDTGSRHVAIRDGEWWIVGRAPMRIDPTLSAANGFELRYDNVATEGEMATTRVYFTLEVDTDAVKWVCLELRDADGALNGENPTKLVLNTYTTRPDHDSETYAADSIRVIALVANHGTILHCHQLVWGDVKYRQGPTNPTTGYDPGAEYPEPGYGQRYMVWSLDTVGGIQVQRWNWVRAHA